MNGGIQPTVELATNNGNNGYYPYPVYPMMSGNGNDGFFGGDGIWALILLALLFGNGGWGMGGFGGGFGGMFEFPWLLAGQQEINSNTNNGFNSLHLSNQIEGIRDDVNDIQNAICNSTASINSNVSNGFYNAEIGANNRQMANMQQAFNSQISTLQGFNNLGSQFADCCCENRLGIQDLKATVISENCTDREVLREIGQNILVNQTANTQKIIDEIFRDRLDEKNDKIADLQRQLQMADLRASQTAQNAFISQGFANEVDALYDRLNNCPVGTVPVYGRQPIFSCNNNGCGCGNNGFYGNGTSF